MAAKYVSKLGTDDALHGSGTGTDAWATIGYALQSSRMAHGDTLIVEDDGGTPYAAYASGTSITLAFSGVKTSGPVTVQPASGATVRVATPVGTSGQLFAPVANIHVVFAEGIDFVNPSAVNVPLFKIINSGAVIEVDGGLNCGGVAATPCQINAGSASEFAVGGAIHNGTGHAITNSSTVSTKRFKSGCRIYDMKSPLSSAGGSIVIEPGAILSAGKTAVSGASGLAIAGAHSVTAEGAILVCGGTLAGNTILIDSAAALHFLANPEAWDVKENKFYSYTFDAYNTDTIQQREDNAATYNAALANVVQCTAQHVSIISSNVFMHPGFTNAECVAGDFSSANFERTRSATLVNSAAFVGDSIMHGWNASDKGAAWAAQVNPCWAQFGVMTGLPIADSVAIPGLHTQGCRMLIDWVMQERAPRYVFLSIGVNNFNGAVYPTGITAAQLAEDIIGILERIEAWGAVPFWMGVESIAGNPPNNTAVIAANDAVEAECALNGWGCKSILTEMTNKTASWKTEFYAGLTTDVHPNDAGQYFIADVADRLYQQHKTGAVWGARSTCDGILPLSAQPCKGHAAPIGVGKITIFPGIASQAQIEEAK